MKWDISRLLSLKCKQKLHGFLEDKNSNKDMQRHQCLLIIESLTETSFYVCINIFLWKLRTQIYGKQKPMGLYHKYESKNFFVICILVILFFDLFIYSSIYSCFLLMLVKHRTKQFLFLFSYQLIDHLKSLWKYVMT